MVPKVIGNSIGGFQNLGKVLFNFDPHNVPDKFLKTDSKKLFNEIVLTLKPSG